MRSAPPAVRLEKWGPGDWDLLTKLNSPEMTAHLGGPESDEKLADRHRRYLAAATTGAVHDLDRSYAAFVYKVVVEPAGAAAGSVSFWDREWRGEQVYEMGWGVLPEYQGRGIASAALMQAVELARATRRRPAVHAYPEIHNGASNGICRKLGFELLGETRFEYPTGNWVTCNDWHLAL